MGTIIISPVVYIGIKQRIHHFADILSEREKVLFIQPPFGSKFKNGNLEVWYPGDSERTTNFKSRRYSLINILNLNYIYQILKIKKYEKDLKTKFLEYKEEGKRNIVIIESPALLLGSELINFFKVNGFKIVYDLADRIDEFEDIPKYTLREEKKIMANCDLIITTHKNLAEYARNFNKNVKIIENGVDVGHFKKGRSEKTRKNTIFYFGTIDSWFDFDLIKIITEKRPDIKIILAGPNRAKLKPPDSVEYVGQVDYNKLPKLIKNLKVGIIPFKKNKLTENVNPIKMYEYLASHKPVVSIGVNIKESIPHTYNSTTYKEFLENLDKALAVKIDPEKVDKFLKNKSWRDKVDQIELAFQVL